MREVEIRPVTDARNPPHFSLAFPKSRRHLSLPSSCIKPLVIIIIVTIANFEIAHLLPALVLPHA
jgi:hypothetical protein